MLVKGFLSSVTPDHANSCAFPTSLDCNEKSEEFQECQIKQIQ